MRVGVRRAHWQTDRDSRSEFAKDVQYYLTLRPRQLPSKYLYDALGSALFEAICELPWYSITRAEARLLQAHRGEVFRHLKQVSTLAELGPGSGEKLRTLLQTGSRRAGTLSLHLIDVSAAALMAASRTLAEVEDVEIVTHETSFELGLQELSRHPPGSMAVLFLGSNIGNFDPPGAQAFLACIRGALAPGDALLLGADLVKPERKLLLAYDDPLGVTAAFNRNVLLRINRELGGNFPVERFDHRAVWNASQSRMEMYLVAPRAQRVRIEAAGLDLDLREGEEIWTESSYKYQPEGVIRLVEDEGFHCVRQWIDAADAFALTLFEAL